MIFQPQADIAPGCTNPSPQTDEQFQVSVVGYVVEIRWEMLRERVLSDHGQRIQKYLNSTHNLIKSLKERVKDNIGSKLTVVEGREKECEFAVSLAQNQNAEHPWKLGCVRQTVLFP